MIHAKIPNTIVPAGFTVPFYWYEKFMTENGFDKIISDLMDNNDFVHNPRIRRQKLENFREMMKNGIFDEELESRNNSKMEKRTWRSSSICSQFVEC